MLAAIPLVVAGLLHRLPGQERERAWPMVFRIGIPLFIWQWVLNGYLYANGDWLSWSRLVDPFIISGLLAAVLHAENQFSDESDKRHRQFYRQLGPWLWLNAVIQAAFMLIPEQSQVVPMLSIIVLGSKIVTAYGRWTIRPRIRQRILVVVWVVCSLIPLPFFRLFFLLHLAYVWLQRLVQQLDLLREQQRVQANEKRVISQISETLATVIQDVSNYQQSLRNYLSGLCGALEIKAGAIYLWDAEAKVFRVGQVHGLFFPLTRSVEHTFMRERALQELVRSLEITDSDNLIWECGHTRLPIHVPFASQDARIQRIGGRGNNIQSLVLSPLLLENELLGVLVLQNKHYERYFTESDAYLIYTFAHYATLMINAARMLGERAERERVQNELLLGQQIQADLLPRKIPKVQGIELAGSMTPAKEIGGDYYDFIEVSSERLGIAIGDVSGKGVPAGMLMTILQTLLHSQYPYHDNTRDLLVSINSSIAEKIKSSMFITFLLFEWNSVRKELKYTACGHEHILHYRTADKRLDCFRSGGIALGMTDDNSAILRERVLAVSPGDTVLLYTDGIVEARNPQGDMYGLDRVKQFFERNHDGEAESLRLALIENLDQFRRGAEQVDDITCIIMRF